MKTLLQLINVKKATPQDINNELPDWKNNKDLLNQLLNL